MTYTTYFEIGGYLVESHVDEHRPPATNFKTLSKTTGIPSPLLKQASKDVQEDLGYDVQRASRAPGRLRRAQWAFTTAAALAAADGPLPLGDIAAIGFLGIYGGYEVVEAVRDLTQL